MAFARHTAPPKQAPTVPLAGSGGQALDRATNAQMSARFGHDLSSIRIHTDARAAQSAAALGADAYALGGDVVFGAGRFQPGSPQTERLLAHELTHVVQQTQFGPGDWGRTSRKGDASECEAETLSARALAGEVVRVQSRPVAAVARTAAPEQEQTPEQQDVGFHQAMQFTARWEGGCANRQDDHGGETMRGITQTNYNAYRQSHHEPGQDVCKGLTDQEHDDIYYNNYWLASHANQMPPALGVSQFDWAVNHGPAGATQTLQESLGMKKADGKWGPQTQAALSAQLNAPGGQKTLVNDYNDNREGWYRQEAVDDPSQKSNLHGWLNRLDAPEDSAGREGLRPFVQGLLPAAVPQGGPPHDASTPPAVPGTAPPSRPAAPPAAAGHPETSLWDTVVGGVKGLEHGLENGASAVGRFFSMI